MRHRVHADVCPDEAEVLIPVGAWYFPCCHLDLCQSQGESVSPLDVEAYFDTKDEALDAIIAEWQASTSSLTPEEIAANVAACEALKTHDAGGA